MWAILLAFVPVFGAMGAETNSGPEDRGFDPAGFREPPSFLWPGYFWDLNDRIDEASLIAQLRDMRAQKRKGARNGKARESNGS
jgi:hypothetical protein